MPLQKEIIRIPLGRGVNAGGKDPQNVQGQNLKVKNMRFPRERVGARRFGTAQVSGTYAGVDSIAAHKDAPVLLGDGVAKRYYGGTFKDGAFADMAAPARVELIDVQSKPFLGEAEAFATTGDIAISGDYAITIVASISPSGTDTMQVFVFDVRTNTVVINLLSTNAAGVTNYAVAATDNGELCLFFSQPTTIDWIKWDPVGGKTTGSSPVLTHNMNSDCIDAMPMGGDLVGITYKKQSAWLPVFVVWDASGNTLAGEYVNATSVTDMTNLFQWEESGVAALGMCWTNWGSGAIYAVVLDDTASEVYGNEVTIAGQNARQISGVMTDDSSNTAEIYWNELASNTQVAIKHATLTEAAGSLSFGGAATRIRSLAFVAKPFRASNDDIHLLTYFEGAGWWKAAVADIDKLTPQRHYFIYKDGQGVVAVALKSRAGIYHSTVTASDDFLDNRNMSNVASPAADNFIIPVTRRVSESCGGLEHLYVNLVPTINNPFEGNDVLYLPSALPFQLDNYDSSEQGFCYYPEGLTVADDGGAAGLWSGTGDVGFVALYEWVDGQGRRHQSAPSPLVTHTIAATTEELIVTIPCLHATRKTDVRIALYRTEVDGSVLYRQQVINNSSTAFTVASILDIGNETIELTIGGVVVPYAETLYTQGGIIENIGPGPHRIACVHQNRYFYVDRDREGERIVYSREFVEDQGTPWNDVLDILVDPIGGDIVALHSFAEKLWILKEYAIYVVTGRGKDDTGGGVGYVKPRMVSASVGCKLAASVVRLPQGLAFLGRDGLYVIGLNEQPQFFGHSIRYFTDTYAITSANTIPDQHLAVWTTSAGPAIVYDFLYDQWSTYGGNYDSVADAVLADNTLYLLKGSTVYVLDLTTKADAGTTFQMRVETAWLTPAGLGGWMRFYRGLIHGYNLGDVKLKAQLGWGQDPVWGPERSFDLSDLSEFGHSDYFGEGLADTFENQAMILQVKGTKQKSNAFRLRITDENSASSTFELTTLAAVVGVKQQALHVGDNRKLTE